MNTFFYEGLSAPNAICEGAQGPNMTRTATNTLHSYFDNLGIRMPPGRAEGSEDRYVYLDSNGNPQQIDICFDNIPWPVDGLTARTHMLREKNVIVIYRMVAVGKTKGF
ncbi:hypothetical protein MNBD_GAMMA03-1091 [hydrothermal vent metagenome]|uniref:Uncharacterized protein n=1 Tax=hydrothermal vent metagenome TaxID=652676 RepID=A0A3B0W4J4_9ZZZZ